MSEKKQTLLSVNDINKIVKNSIPKGSIKIKAEIRKPVIKGGHLYMDLKQDNNTVQAIVWRSKVTNDIKKLKDGDNITAQGYLNYYEARGSINVIINKLLSTSGTGDLMLEYEKLKKDFEDKGYYNKELPLPSKLENILILSSKSGAAIQDFYHVIESYKCDVKMTLIDVSVQGDNCPKSIIDYLNSNDTADYDLVVITRGGGSFEDLFGFCKAELVECVYNLESPVLSAIGHQVDTTLLDYVADYKTTTPTEAAHFIVKHNEKYKTDIKDKLNDYKEDIKEMLLNNIYKLQQMKTKFNTLIKDIGKKIIINSISDDIKKLYSMKINTGIDITDKNNNTITIDNLTDILDEKIIIINVGGKKVELNINSYNFI
jgi:exodeoxyribonuclease VII large subunit